MNASNDTCGWRAPVYIQGVLLKLEFYGLTLRVEFQGKLERYESAKSIFDLDIGFYRSWCTAYIFDDRQPLEKVDTLETHVCIKHEIDIKIFYLRYCAW